MKKKYTRKKNNLNRRSSKRLKINESVMIPIYVGTVSPFIGDSTLSKSINISTGGMALQLLPSQDEPKIKKGDKIKVHFRLPGMKLLGCSSVVTHKVMPASGELILGIRFLTLPKRIKDLIEQMLADNELCDERIREERHPWCLPSCSYYRLCRKPLRANGFGGHDHDVLEISLQAA